MLRSCSAALAVTMMFSVCYAEDPKPKGKDKFKSDPDRLVDAMLLRLDKNRDGKIAKDEAQGRMADNFKAIDKNADGYLDKDELLSMARLVGRDGPLAKDKDKFKGAPQRGLPEFDSVDKNADGRLNREEVKGTPVERSFSEIDSNKDGKLDPKEYKAYRDKQATRQ